MYNICDFSKTTKTKKTISAKWLCFGLFLIGGAEVFVVKLYTMNANVMPQDVFFFYTNLFLVPFVIFMIKRKTTIKGLLAQVKKVKITTIFILIMAVASANIGSYVLSFAIKGMDLAIYSMLNPSIMIILGALVSKFAFKETLGTAKIASMALLIGAIVITSL